MVSINKADQSNEALRYQRLLRGWSLQRVVDELCLGIKTNGKMPGVNANMVGQWERGIKTPSPYYREKLCLLYGVTADRLDFIIPSAKRQPASTAASRNAEHDMDKKRREIIRMITSAGAALALPLPDLDWERINDALNKSSLADKVLVENLAGINSHLWSLYLATSVKSSVLDGVSGQFKMLVQLLREPHTASIHQRLCVLASELAQLAGEIYFDRHEPDTAQSCYVFAASAAKEAQAYDLWSCALIRHSFIAIYDQDPRYEDALPFLRGARRLAERGDSTLPTRYWAAAVEAEAESGVQNLVACQNALDLANEVREITQASPAWTRFDGSRLPALRGACYVRLGQPGLAMPALEEALSQFTKPGRKQGMVLLDLAHAAIQSRDIEQSCLHLHAVADIVELGASGFLHDGILSMRQHLELFAGTAAVHGLDRRLHLLA